MKSKLTTAALALTVLAGTAGYAAAQDYRYDRDGDRYYDRDDNRYNDREFKGDQFEIGKATLAMKVNGATDIGRQASTK